MNHVAFVTGGSGFIGGELIRHIYLSGLFSKAYILIRELPNRDPQKQVLKIVDRWKVVYGVDVREDFIHIVVGDLAQISTIQIPEDVTHVFHVAAHTRFDETLQFSRRVNLGYTQNLLLRSRAHKNLKLFVHFSTAFVMGASKGIVNEEHIPTSFRNNYERTKYEAEQCVKSYGVPYVIVRPSIVVGDSVTGYTQHFRIFYSMFRAWLHGKIPRAPVHSVRCVDVVPVDFVCRATLALIQNPHAENNIFNLCAGEKHLVDPLSIFKIALEVFEKPLPPLISVKFLQCLNSRLLSPLVNDALKGYLQTMSGHFPYMMPHKHIYDTTKTMKFLEGSAITCPNISEYGETLFVYCRKSNWGRQLQGVKYVSS